MPAEMHKVVDVNGVPVVPGARLVEGGVVTAVTDTHDEGLLPVVTVEYPEGVEQWTADCPEGFNAHDVWLGVVMPPFVCEEVEVAA